MDSNNQLTCSDCKYCTPPWSGPVIGNWSCSNEEAPNYNKPCIFEEPCELFTEGNEYIISEEKARKIIEGAL